jgi:ketosteroid isomerase-like protein
VTVSDIERWNGFDENEIRAAESALELSLAAADPTSWVFDYTEDAVFDAGGHVVQGRAALLEMATGMSPLSEVSIRPLRTEGSGRLATVWCEASWVSGPPESGTRTEVRGIIVWRKESDDRWRVALEHIA